MQKSKKNNCLDYSPLNKVVTTKEALKAYYDNQKSLSSTSIPALVAAFSLVGVIFFFLIPVLLIAIGLYTTAIFTIIMSLTAVLIRLGTANSRGKLMLRLNKFASLNGLYYSPSAISNEKGIFAQNVSEDCYVDRLMGVYNNKEVLVSNYKYFTKGNNKKNDIVGIADIKMPKYLPNVFLDSNKNNTQSTDTIIRQINGAQKYSLEGDFDKFFTLYATSDYQRDMLYFLTPELMALLVDSATDYDIEVIDNSLKLYKPGGFDYSEDSMKTLFALIDNIGGEFIENTDKYADTRSAENGEVSVGGKRLKRSQWPVVVTLLIFSIYILFFHIIPFLSLST